MWHFPSGQSIHARRVFPSCHWVRVYIFVHICFAEHFAVPRSLVCRRNAAQRADLLKARRWCEQNVNVMNSCLGLGGNSNIFYFSPYLGRWCNLTCAHFFSNGWFNHQGRIFFSGRVPKDFVRSGHEKKLLGFWGSLNFWSKLVRFLTINFEDFLLQRLVYVSCLGGNGSKLDGV